MNLNDTNSTSLADTGASSGAAGSCRARETEKSGQSSRTGNTTTGIAGSSDDVHLSELVRSLRALAADSPERQANIEQLARSYANGTYKVNSSATAAKIVEDAQAS